MRFELAFDSTIHNHQVQLIFDEFWKKSLAKTKVNVIVAIASFICGGWMVLAGSLLGYLFLSMGLFYLLNVVNVYSHFRKTKKAYFEVSEQVTLKLAQSDSLTVWEFLEDHFYYKDSLVEGKLSWETVKGLKIIGDNLIMEIQYGIPANYILGKEEVGDENFSKIKTFVQHKIETHML